MMSDRTCRFGPISNGKVAQLSASPVAATLRVPVPVVSSRAVFGAAAAVTAIVLVLRNSYLFTTHIYEDSDFALNSILVQRAEHLQLLVGNYSRLGFHHPGPAFLYVLAAGEAVFYHLLRIVPTPYNGQLLGAFLLGSALVGVMVAIVHRVTRSISAALATLAVLISFAGLHTMLANIWFPYLYMAVFAAFMVTAAALAAGHTEYLPLYVITAGFLVHGHVSFVMFVVVTTAAVAAGWTVRHRGRHRLELAEHRKGLRASVALLCLFALPMVLQVIINYPGAWPQYWHYITRHATAHPLGATLRFVGWFWSSHPVPVWLTVVALAVLVALLATERDADLRRFFGALVAVFALESLLFVAYVARGVDLLSPLDHYVGDFFVTVPMLLVAAAAAYAAARIERDATPAWIAVAMAGVVALGVGITRNGLTNPYRGDPAYPAIAAALAANPARAGRPVAITFPLGDWPLAAGVVIAARRGHLPVCVAGRGWETLFTAPLLCRGTADQWALNLMWRSQWRGPGHAVWNGDQVVLAEPLQRRDT